ncbi:PAS domain S-box protein [Hymenobacter sp. BT190]|uniref:PAS domain S-box protein n=1 Tax=Hymenobacter sp. BT190 TaxID=2763505 RepID=UPI00165121D5|nr:PAS domain S-box protein [Hymenobacter sp. BT190]MBC6700531.1 PAS domain S-box protein [Hymenobacter sp. BT190]
MNLPPSSFLSASGYSALTLLEGVFDAVVLLAPDGNLQWANPNFLRLTGFADVQAAAEVIQEAMTAAGSPLAVLGPSVSNQTLPFTLALRRADGSRLPVRLKVQPQPTGWLGLLDVEQAGAFSANTQQEQEARFNYLTDQVPGVLFQWRDANGIAELSYISPQLQLLFGLAPTQVHTLPSLLHPDDLPHWRSAARRTRRLGVPFVFEGRLLVPGQPMRWLRATAQLSRADATGKLYSGLLTDSTALRQAEAAVQDHEQRWRLAIEQFGDGAWEFNYQTGAEYFSQAYHTMLGYLPGGPELLPRSWEQHVHPDDRAISLEAAAAYLNGTKPIYSVERRLRCQDGSYKWVLTRGLITQRDEHGAPLTMTGVHTDISALKETSLALEASTLRFATTIASLQEGILLEDEHQHVVLANDALCDIFKLNTTPTQLVGYNTRLLEKNMQHQFRQPETFVQRYTTIVQARRPVTDELFELADGRIVQTDFVPIFVAERYIGHLWKFQDITERKHNEDALRQREEKYRGIIDNMNMGLVEMDLNRQVMFINKAFSDITGYSKQDFSDQHTLDRLMSPEDISLAKQRDLRRRLGESETYETSITDSKGTLKWLLVSAAPLYDEAQQVYGSIAIILDITHQKELEHNLRAAKEQAEDLAQAKELFLANMSHEIRTPMNAILGMGQLLAKTPLDAVQLTYLRAIETSGENLLVILNDILDLSKIGASQLQIEQIGFSLSDLLLQIEKSLHFKAEEKGLAFQVKLDEQLPAVLLGDPYRITQVLLNLAGNSIKFTEKGSVTVACTQVSTDGTHALVHWGVTDTGIGIDADYLANIFKEFSQEDSSVTRRFGGTGLGLSISRQLVQLMGGEISIDSQKHQGTHSHFVLRLPIGTAEDLPRKTLITANIREKLRGRQVLLVEDNHFNRQIAKGFLHNAGVLVQEAENGAQAVELARHGTFDVVLMDVQMPVMNGLEATTYLRQHLQLRTPIIALTANAVKGEREKCLQAGMNDYLAKPFQEDKLLKLLCIWTLGEFPVEATNLEYAASTPESGALYNLDIVRQIGQNSVSFTVLMLESFIESCEEAITELHAAIEQQDSTQIRAAAHKLKPSLDHLQVYSLLPLVVKLNNCPEPFDAQQLPQLVAQTVTQLQELIGQMTLELQELQQELE